MPAARQAVAVEGLEDFQRELRTLGKELAKGLQRTNKRFAEKARDRERQLYDRTYGGGRGFSRRGITARATARKAAIVIGGARRPWLLGQNFGSTGRFPQFVKPPLGGRPDRFHYTAIAQTSPAMVEEYGREFDELARKAFPLGSRLGLRGGLGI